MQSSMARTNDSANEVVFGIRVVRSFHTEMHEASRYDKRLMETHSLKTRRDTVRAIYLLARRVRSSCFLFAPGFRDIWGDYLIWNVCLVDRFGHAGVYIILWKTFHPEGTDDHRKPGFLHPLPVWSWWQHQGECSMMLSDYVFDFKTKIKISTA